MTDRTTAKWKKMTKNCPMQIKVVNYVIKDIQDSEIKLTLLIEIRYASTT